MQRDLGKAALGGNAGRLIAEMRCGVDEDTSPSALDNKQIVSLHQLLHEAKFKDPDKEHLSPAGLPLPPPMPLYLLDQCRDALLQIELACSEVVNGWLCMHDAGEYNLRLGILKELNPELVATHQGEPIQYNVASLMVCSRYDPACLEIHSSVPCHLQNCLRI